MKFNLQFFIFIVITLTSGLSMAAVNPDFATVDRLTYRCYEEKKWDSVILVGEQALQQNIDYYYLRTRIGISYFNKSRYFPASIHLKKAREFNSQDPIIADYLYYAYAFSNQADQALKLEPFMTNEARESINNVVQDVHVESGYTLSSNANPANLATLMEKDSIYGEQDLYGNSFYSNLGLKLRVSKRVNLSLAYNYLNFTKTKYIQYGRGEEKLINIQDTTLFFIQPPDSGQWYNYGYQWAAFDTSFRYHVSQHELHISASFAPGSGFRIMPAFHFMHVAYTMTNSSYRTDTIEAPLFHSIYTNITYYWSYPQLNYSFSQKDTSFNNYVAALAITKDFGLFNIGLSGSWSNLNGKKQKQIGAALTYYPLRNLNLYGTTAVTGFMQGKNKRLLYSQVIGAKITSWMWGEANFYYGDYTNANIFNGSVVYNNSDIINYRGGATLIFLVGKHIRLSLIYQYFNKESQQIYYIKQEDPDTHQIKEVQQTKTNPYNTNTLIGGITWKF
jgi:hypothetical protein